MNSLRACALWKIRIHKHPLPAAVDSQLSSVPCNLAATGACSGLLDPEASLFSFPAALCHCSLPPVFRLLLAGLSPLGLRGSRGFVLTGISLCLGPGRRWHPAPPPPSGLGSCRATSSPCLSRLPVHLPSGPSRPPLGPAAFLRLVPSSPRASAACGFRPAAPRTDVLNAKDLASAPGHLPRPSAASSPCGQPLTEDDHA